MRILKLHFKNLNSLLGEWTIDFSLPEFAEQGIFAITGPTGAGKSTILDAICLALYGQTPRLGKITSQNEIMSRQSGECFASLEFKTNAGHYRTLWSQTRARKKAAGNLQTAQHVIEDLSDPENKLTLEDKLSKVPTKVSEVTGMDFEHFTRAMLLAQGGFAKFLHSPADERSPILEKITGTEIYSAISKKVHEHKTTEENKLGLLEQQLQGVKLLNSAEITQLAAQIAELEKQLALTVTQKTASEQQQLWLNNLQVVRLELTQLIQHQAELQTQQQQFAAQELALNWADKASAINSDVYIGLTQLRTQIEQLTASIANNQQQLPQVEQRMVAANNALLKSTQEFNQYKVTFAANLQVLQQVRRLDTQIETSHAQVAKVVKTVSEAQHNLEGLAAKATQLKTQLNCQHQQLTEVNNYLEQHSHDARLVVDLSGITGRLDNLQSLAIKRQNDQLRQQQALAQAEQIDQELAGLNQQQHSLNQTIATQQNQFSELSQAHTQLANGQTILSLTQERAALQAQHTELQSLAKLLKDTTNLEQQALDVANTLAHENQRVLEINPQIMQTEHHLAAIEELLNSLSVQQLLLSKVADLTLERDNLQLNQPCPLCGALEHPYATNLPRNDELEQQIMAAKLRQTQTQFTLNQHNQQLTKSLTLIEQSTKQQAHLQLNLSELKQQVNLLSLKHALLLNAELPAQLVDKLHLIETQIPAHERLIEQLHAYEQQLNQLKIEQQQLVEQLQALQIALSQSSANQAASSAQLLQIQEELAQTDTMLTQAAQQLSTELLAYLSEPISLEQIGVIKQQLQQRVTNWQTQQQQAEQLQLVINQFTHEMQQNALLQETITQVLMQTKLELEQLQCELNALVSQRQELFADKDANQEQVNWQQYLELLESNYQTAQNNYTQAQQQFSTLNSLLANQAEQFQPLQVQRQQREACFQQSLIAQGFSNELDFKAKLLSREIIAEIQQRANRLKQTAIELNTQQQQLNRRISAEENKALTTRSLAELAVQITQLGQTIDNYTQQIGALGLQLKLNEQAQQQQAEIIARHSQQKIINQRWGNLHKLIGSADGKKFRNFAQGLTFEMVVKHANQQLLNMSDRYLLMRDKTLPLELNVVDNYQGGEIRSTKNLSGGESFVISLALALGLSKLSSNKVQVDSLFLDEGFGTLDEEALQTALTALDSLQRDGKLIGIISHVGALKERINLQIQVEPLSGGVSRISGVGCSAR